MAFTATINAIIASTQGGHSDTLTLVPFVNLNSPIGHITPSLSNGATTITPPANALYAVIVPPTTSTITKTLKGISGDTGLPMSLVNWSIIALAATPGAFIIAANGVETIDVYFF